MTLLEAITVYAHAVQANNGGMDGRKAAFETLRVSEIPESVIDAIADTVSNEGALIGKDGARFAITQIAAC